jgi:hypothetical protein
MKKDGEVEGAAVFTTLEVSVIFTPSDDKDDDDESM